MNFAVVFEVEYRTCWGESLAVELVLKKRGTSGTQMRYVSLSTQDGARWTGDIMVSDAGVSSFEYGYVVMSGGDVVRREWLIVPRIFSAKTGMTFIMKDFWRDIPQMSYLYSSAYTNIVSNFVPRTPELVCFDKSVFFRVQAPQLRQGEALALTGSQPPLGAWNTERLLRMSRGGVNEWVLALSGEGLYLPFEYKYVVIDDETGTFLRWEDGDNRRSPSMGLESGQALVLFDEQLRINEEHWKSAGVVVPVFSLRSTLSQGVGDFGDLRLMVDWVCQTGMHVIQLLPVYDTTQTHTWTDSYPYNSISIYALHPIYIDLEQLPPINDAAWQFDYEKTRRELNDLPQVDYERASALKQDYLHRLYKQEGRKVMASEAYQSFYAQNQHWLVPYTVFCMLRDKYGTCDFLRWPRYKTYKADEIFALYSKKQRETGYYAYVQFLLDRQLSETSQYARSQGVMLKCDIPIGISRHSVEAWVEPYYFHMNGQAGAPPDAFCADGQNWGFPTYNWERMAQDGYQWWVRRFRKMAQYFDAYRIDHVLGFFRIWQIPVHSVHGLLGQFSPSLPMSAEEIEGYGLTFRPEFLTRPYITDTVLDDIFGSLASEVRSKYLIRHPGGTYAMRKGFETQREVEVAFADSTDEEKRIRDGLYRLISNVLFVPDIHNPQLLHPRIAAVSDYAFRSLPQHEQEAFCRLHDDYYYHRHNDFWGTQAMQKLPVLVQATRMLACAEDLGMVPACVGPVLDRLGMLSLEIQSMPKRVGQEFGSLQDNPYHSVCTVFTHDMPTLREWWEEDYDRTQRYYNQVLQHDGPAPRVIPAWLCEEVLARHLYSPSMLCLISLQDWLSISDTLRYDKPSEERINVPSNPRNYWRYRMHVSIQALMGDDSFCERIRQMIIRSGRE